MKWQIGLTLAACSAVGFLFASTLPTKEDSGIERRPTVEIGDWIDHLADPNFTLREKASRKIWEAGEEALPALQRAASGRDPEQAFRARELIRKIDLSLTPNTDPAIIEMVDLYQKSAVNEKRKLFSSLLQKRAWRQILKLYAVEQNVDLRNSFQEQVNDVALRAARECLVENNPKRAQEFLEMAPANAVGLLALAEFHRSQGSLPAELKLALASKGKNADQWQLALQRAAGNLPAARDAAIAAGETEIAAVMSILLGDPLPWLRTEHPNQGENDEHKTYKSIAIRRWQGEEIPPAELDQLLRNALKPEENDAGPQEAINILFLLGETKRAEAALTKTAPFAAFQYFDTLERLPEALAALQLDPVSPDYNKWIAERLAAYAAADEDQENHSKELGALVGMANFLERRGLVAQAEAAFTRPLLEIAAKDQKIFTMLLGNLLRVAPRLAKKVTLEWVGQDDTRWSDVLAAVFGENEMVNSAWLWLAELDPKCSLLERFDGMLALFDAGKDSNHLRPKWLKLAWEAIDRTPKADQMAALMRLYHFTAPGNGRGGNVKHFSKTWDALETEQKLEIPDGQVFINFSAIGRTKESIDIFEKEIAQIVAKKQEPLPERYAYLAGFLRRAGRAKEAAVYDGWVDKLSLGSPNSAFLIAQAYALNADFQRSGEWWARAARFADPQNNVFSELLKTNLEPAFERGEWLKAAAISEVMAESMVVSQGQEQHMQAIVALGQRMLADSGRALSQLKTDRAGSLVMLEACHRLCPGHGSLADTFFPALRKAGLIAEHDRWFAISWKLMEEVIKAFPESDNTLNTAAWLAARSRLKLDQAELWSKKALTLVPDEAAYLDTFAEIQFARGDRPAAIKWSDEAVNFLPQDSQLRRQNHRFKTESLPRQ